MTEVPPSIDSQLNAGGAPPRRSFSLNLLYAVGGSGFYHICHLGVQVLLAKLASPAILGQYLLSVAIATPILLLCGLELRSALIADVRDRFTVGTYLAARQLTLIPAGLALGLIVVWQAHAGASAASLLILGGVFIAQLVWSLSEFGWGTYQRRERLDLFATSCVLRGLTLFLPFAVLLPWYHLRLSTGQIPPERLAEGAGLASLLYALGFILSYLLFDRPRVLGWRPAALHWDGAGVRAVIAQTVPLGLVAVTINLCDTFPRWVFADKHTPDGPAQLGYFGALAYITMAGNLILIQAGNTAANRLSWYYQHDLRAWWRLMGKLTLLALGIGLGALAVVFGWGEWILRTLYRPDYAQFNSEFRLIIVAQCLALLTTIWGVATTQMRLFWLQVPAQLLTLAVTVTAAITLIPGPHPVRGAALTALARASIQLLLYGLCLVVGLARRERLLAQPARAHAAGEGYA